MDLSDVILLAAFWWGILSLLAAYVFLRNALSELESVESSSVDFVFPDDSKEEQLRREYLEYQRSWQKWQSTFAWKAFVFAMKLLFWPLVFGERLTKRWDRLPLAAAIRRIANTKLKWLLRPIGPGAKLRGRDHDAST